MVVAWDWPLWLPTIQALKLPLWGGYFPTKYHQFFRPRAEMPGWQTLKELFTLKKLSPDTLLLGSGSYSQLRQLRSKFPTYPGGMIFVIVLDLAHISSKSAQAGFTDLGTKVPDLGMKACILKHNEFGGATNGAHLICFDEASGLESVMCRPPVTTPRVLRHIIDSAVRTKRRLKSIPPPPPLPRVPRVAIEVEGLLRGEGLWDVH